MLNGGSTVLLEGDATWNAPGGGTAHLDAESGEALLVFHALKMSEGGRQYVWLKHLSWANGWPTML